MAWEPPFEESCPVVNYTVNYRKVMSAVKKSKWRSITVNRNATSFTLQLNCKNEYDIAVTSVGEYWQSALNDSKIWNFKTGGGKHSLCDMHMKKTIVNFIKSLRQRYRMFSKLKLVCCSELYIDSETDYLASLVFMRVKPKTNIKLLKSSKVNCAQ